MTNLRTLIIATSLLIASAFPVYADGIFNPGSSSGGGAGMQVLAKTAASPGAVTGTASETLLAAVTVPANLFGPNGQMRITAYWTCTSSANNKTLRVRLGGLTGSVEFSSVQTTNAFVISTAIIANTGATNAQINYFYAARGSDGLLTTGGNNTTAVDTTVNQSLVFSGQLATTAETITLVGYLIEYING